MGGVLLGFGLIFTVLGVATLLEKKQILNDEGSRKFIHIGVANWIIVVGLLTENVWLALIAPVLFIIVNALSFRFDLIKAMERDEKSAADLGTVYYAITLAIITYFSYQFDLIVLGIYAILVMGYGDGLSAVLGKAYGHIKLYQKKSLVGFLTVFASAMILGFIFISNPLIWIPLALVAALIELLTPHGFDNLSLPLGLFFLGWLVL